jgi:hypothetical protein
VFFALLATCRPEDEEEAAARASCAGGSRRCRSWTTSTGERHADPDTSPLFLPFPGRDMIACMGARAGPTRRAVARSTGTTSASASPRPTTCTSCGPRRRTSAPSPAASSAATATSSSAPPPASSTTPRSASVPAHPGRC